MNTHASIPQVFTPEASLQSTTGTILEYHQDNSHGWVLVTYFQLLELGIADQISKYSYRKLNAVYLEEDRDLTLFVRAFYAKYRELPQFREIHHRGEAGIRNLNAYTVVG